MISGEVCATCGGRLWSRRCQRLACPAGAENRARDRRSAERRAEIRNPPPCTFDGVAGVCRLCGTPVVKPRRTWCSQACVDIYTLSRFPAIAAGDLRTFYPGCWQCGVLESFDVAVEVEHVVPLWSLDELERGELKWWLPFNLQLLCRPCHRAKMAIEADVRARLRKLAMVRLAESMTR